ncbi:hypothetical protein crov441 [Cafeteria roenbergensis virus]|uniref:Uncharacterized protein n=1 Tax=Cafeteria roenbergensis virus (strain BV-PW1) TaxID=693272 RepID=E3T5L2_CROVB|nr:hypothetical protein crov441 [Cafeteria roenbergensis virus BV-PW1]ADO67475.1 hypothetical protein crov441 [Cafeteria roenbergensis virus BV-PW1]
MIYYLISLNQDDIYIFKNSTTIIFNSNFNTPLTNIEFPISLTTLNLGRDFNQLIM